jgi:glycosyltransferase involved in cell wall biosynthesis
MNRPLVSVVVIGYRRPELLERTVESLLRVTQYRPLELILADDGSPSDMQERMRKLPFDRFVMASQNRGLGANANAGLRAASGEMILQLQDDFECTGPGDYLARAVAVLREAPDIGLIRLTNFADIGSFRARVIAGSRCRVFDWPGEPEELRWLYSDNPHLKRRAVHETIGYYAERIRMELTETDFCRRFNRARTFGAAAIDGYDAFRHIGAERSHRRGGFKERTWRVIERLPGGAAALRTYSAFKAQHGRKS